MSAILIAACLAWTHLKGDVVELPLGLHTYERLAAELTERGIPTRCDPAIRHRYALIRVPPRPWDSLQPLLESALEIKFAALGEGGLEITKDPGEAVVEAALLKRLSRLYSQTIQDAVQGGWDNYRRLETEPNREGIDPIGNLMESIHSLPLASPVRNALNVALGLKQETAHRYVYADLWNGVDLAGLLKRDVTTVMSGEELAAWRPPDNPIGSISLSPVNVYREWTRDEEPASVPRLVDSWQFDPTTFNVKRRSVFLMNYDQPAIGWDAVDPVSERITFEAGWNDLYQGLPFLKAYQNRVKATSKWMDSDASAEPLSAKKGPDSLSSMFSRWSAASNHPVIMEVLPNRDARGTRQGSIGGPLTLRLVLRGLSEEAITPSFLRYSWSVGDLDGITVVRDELRFVDHLAPVVPDAAVLLSERREKAEDGVNSADDLLDAAGLVPIEEQVASIGSGIYGELNEYPFACAYLQLIQTNPDCVKGLKKLKLGRELEFPMTQFSSDARKKFERTMRQIADRLPAALEHALLPDFDRLMAASNLTIQGDKLWGSSGLTFQLNAKSGQSPRWSICPIHVYPVTLAR